MSLVGNLEDLGLGEILQIVSLSRKSGHLALQSKGRQGLIVFRNGQVIQANSSGSRNFIGEVLVKKGITDGASIRQALEIQQEGGYRERLGDILVRRFNASAERIEEVVREHIERLVYSMFAWEDGTFEFELQENPEETESSRLAPQQFMLQQGVNPQFLAIEGSRLIDELRHRGEEPDDGSQWGDPDSPATADLAPDSPEEAVSPPPAVQETNAARGTVVLVDDDASTRDFLVAALSPAGFTAIPFGGSEEALIRIDDLCRGGERPKVLVDLIMPRMDGSGILGGLEMLEMLHNNFADLPVLVMSDYHNSEAQRRIREMGLEFILKPRRSELGDRKLGDLFSRRLQEALDRLEGGSDLHPGGINLGDELRQELGEAASAVVPQQSTGITLLRGMLEELNDPALGGEIILLVLRFASEFMNRAVIFSVKEHEIAGLGQFGINYGAGMTDSRVRSLRIPRGEESLFSQVFATNQPLKVRPGLGKWNEHLFAQLGGIPAEAFLGPIVSAGKVVAILYGDNLPENKPVGDTDSLEIFLSQAGMALERGLLQSRLKEKSPEVT